jgi:hypothetical protein
MSRIVSRDAGNHPQKRIFDILDHVSSVPEPARSNLEVEGRRFA